MRKILVAMLVALCGAVLLAQGPLTPIANLAGRTDSNGALMMSAGAYSGTQGPLTPIGNLRGRTDSNGYLLATVAGGTVTPDSICLTGANPDACLVRDAANTLAQRNGTNAQALNIYNTFTDASNYERGLVSWVSNIFTVGTESAGTGTARGMTLKPSGGAIVFNTGGSDRWSVQNGGGFVANSDNVYDVGAAGATRPRTGYFGTDVIVAGASVTTGVATGYKVARGATAFDASNPTTVATGLTSVVSCAATLRLAAALTTGTAFVTHAAPSAGNVDWYAWVIAGTASTGTETFDWVCVGT